MKRLTLFTWGYYGWGNAAKQFIAAAAAVEKSRGFKPPIFVDIRIRRSGRAKGFKGAAFEKLLPAGRHKWMKELGNKAILSRSDPEIQIAEPRAANDLLDLAVASANKGARLIFFCGCQWPNVCHRLTVVKLVLEAAKKRGVKIQVVEWPGWKPRQTDLEVTPASLAAVSKGRMSVPLGKRPNVAEVASLPWGSIATLHSGGKKLHRLVGPAVWQKGEWHVPIFGVYFDDPDTGLADYKKLSEEYSVRAPCPPSNPTF